MAEALVEVRKRRLLLKLTLVVNFTADLLLEYLVIELFNVCALVFCTSLLQVQFLIFVFLLELDVCVEEAVAS